MDKESAKKQMLVNFMAVGGSAVSFVELMQGIPKGDISLSLPDNDNIILWTNLTEEAAEAFKEIWSEKILKPNPTEDLVYLMDGAYPTLPVVKSNRKYKKPHWLPLSFDKGLNWGSKGY